VGVGQEPVPGVGDHGLELRFLGFPSQLGPYLVARGHYDRRIPRAPGRLDGLYAPPRYPVSRFYDFAHREACPVAKVVDVVLPLPRRLEGEKVCAAEVLDVDIVAHRRAVARGVVGAEDLDRIVHPCRHLERYRDDLGLGTLDGAEATASTGDVEVAEAYRAQTTSSRLVADP
jgi:hypothetical protein